MKKILLITAIATSALTANANLFDFDTGHPYIKVHAGVTKGKTIKDEDGDKFHSKYGPIGTLAVGYNLTDMIRSDLSVDYSNIKNRNKSTFATQEYRTNPLNVLLNFYGDIVEMNEFSLFLGAGAGFNSMRVKYKASVPILGISVSENVTKRKTKFSYAFYAGTGYEVSPGTHIELMFAFKDLGKITFFDPEDNSKVHNKVRTMNLTAGVRFAL